MRTKKNLEFLPRMALQIQEEEFNYMNQYLVPSISWELFRDQINHFGFYSDALESDTN